MKDSFMFLVEIFEGLRSGSLLADQVADSFLASNNVCPGMPNYPTEKERLIEALTSVAQIKCDDYRLVIIEQIALQDAFRIH
ncbi:hypothetical protein IDAT_01075 [Pseudidiomarina atlantica]|uniref:Uncharacterized protein n=1 Tax=Pseudidiomarina atlantica TaxID=1517416 RepID=A0A094JAX0_9GAMM|nr:hypothetical protein [Pseudidiomarina atlantica]KFZ29726.1 hypothetical protein IDAT_01075 [Pseudidiomarina atlantica]